MDEDRPIKKPMDAALEDMSNQLLGPSPPPERPIVKCSTKDTSCPWYWPRNDECSAAKGLCSKQVIKNVRR